MNFARAVSLFFVATMLVAAVALAQAPRTDAIWAKRSQKPIVLNGVLSEPAWAVAESVVIRMAQDAGVPGSGWKYEGGVLPVDPTHATLKFLVVGNQLYMGARVRDQSIGGSQDFNRFDGFLMGLKDHAEQAALDAAMATNAPDATESQYAQIVSSTDIDDTIHQMFKWFPINSHYWLFRSYDLTNLGGAHLDLRGDTFSVLFGATDWGDGYNTGMYVDDVHVYYCDD